MSARPESGLKALIGPENRVKTKNVFQLGAVFEGAK
jgi:hypothetical protein